MNCLKKNNLCEVLKKDSYTLLGAFVPLIYMYYNYSSFSLIKFAGAYVITWFLIVFVKCLVYKKKC